MVFLWFSSRFGFTIEIIDDRCLTGNGPTSAGEVAGPALGNLPLRRQGLENRLFRRGVVVRPSDGILMNFVEGFV